MARSGPGWCPFATQVEGVTKFTSGGEPKVGFCDHTAGGFYGTLADPGFWNRQGYSVHFGISRNGEVCQVVNIFDTAWAQGLDSRGMAVGPDSPGVSWPPFAAMGKRSPNNYLISTEHEDYESVNGVSRAIPNSEWTEAEFQADLKVKRWCYEETRRVKGTDLMPFGLDSLASHHMFDPVNRAYCAGKFWREQYRVRLHGLLGVPPVDVLQQEEIMQRHNSISTRLQGATGGVAVTPDMFDVPPPPAKLLRIEVFLKNGPGGALQVFDADGKYAGQVGWDGGRYGTVDVTPQFSLQGNGIVSQLGVVGFFA